MGASSARAFGSDNRTWLDAIGAARGPAAEPDVLPFACPLCGKRWRQARSVIQHLESIFHRANEMKAEKAERALEAFRSGLTE